MFSETFIVSVVCVCSYLFYQELPNEKSEFVTPGEPCRPGHVRTVVTRANMFATRQKRSIFRFCNARFA